MLNIKKDKSTASIFLLICILICLASGVVVFFWAMDRDPLEYDLNDDRVLSTLFIIDNENKPLGTYLFLYYAPLKRFAIFEISGDIGLLIEDLNRVDRIDSVYTSSNITPYVREIEKIVAIKINYTIVLNLKNLASVVDILEGVSVFIPTKVEYFSSEDSVLFPAGLIKLDGNKAKEYITFNDPDVDMEPIHERNQRFFTGLIKRIGEKNNYLNNSQVFNTFAGSLDVNMNHKTLKRLLNALSVIDTDRMAVASVGGNYKNVSGKKLLIPYYDSTLIKQVVSQTLTTLTQKNQGTRGGERVWTVEILNGTSTAGLANRTSELIRSFGYDVISVGNADNNNYAKTEIIDRSNTPDQGAEFGKILNCTNIVNESYPQSEFGSDAILDITNYEYKADFTLIIGKDFNGRYTTN
ncbi:MAG: LCP family protein [Spirochaetaceae bacterium]|nr:LCP family protein [Spirochaetaceae bacterium]